MSIGLGVSEEMETRVIAMRMIRGQWPGDETEEELLATLKAMG